MSELDQLTEQERDEYSKLLVNKILNSKEELKFWLLYFLDVDLADCKVSRHATSTPLDMTWDIYNFCKSGGPDDEPLSTFYIAGRGSQKTLSAAVLAIILPLHFKRGVIHLGGTETQADRAYIYFKKFAKRKYIKDFLKDDPKISKTTFIVEGNEVEVEILPITDASVQGPHQSVVSIDELGSLAPNKLAAYPFIGGIPVYTQDGKPWVQFGISSRKGRYTIIETEYEERFKTGAIFKFWTIMENTQRCPDSISGTESLEMFVNVFENTALLSKDYDLLPILEKEKFEKVNARTGCWTCPLRSACGGDLKHQTSTCRSLQPVKSTIKIIKKDPLEMFLSQRMSLQPSSEDLVYPRFDRKVFEKTPRELWTIFTGTDPGLDIHEDLLIDMMIKAGVKRYAGIDHGYTHPFAIVVIFEDGMNNAYIMTSYEESGLEPDQVVDTVVKFKNKYHFTIAYPDTSNPAVNKMIGKVVQLKTDFRKSVDDGIQLIRQKMRPNVGLTKLYGIKGNCEPLINNLEKYHFSYGQNGKLTDSPVKEFDDSHDALSYAAQNRWNKGKPIIQSNQTQHSDMGKDQKETPEAYKAKVEKQYSGWMEKEIGTAVENNEGEIGTTKAKSGSYFWNID